MADIKQGDRVVKMSGVCAGKYGTVNSVRENGTLNVTFDGERLPRYCDPMRCGQVATNAKFKVGDRVWFKAPVTGAKVTAKITATLGGEKYGFMDDDGIQGTIEGNAIYPLNSSATNARAFDKGGRPVKEGDTIDTPKGMAEVVAIKMRPQGLKEVASYVGVTYTPGGRHVEEWLMADVHGTVRATLQNARAANAKFKVGDKVKHKTNGLTGIIEGRATEPGNYNVRSEGRVFMWDEDDLALANSRAANEKFKVGDKIQISADVGAWRKGENGTIIGGDYLPGYFYVKFDDGSEGRIPEDKMTSRAANAVRNVVARNAGALPSDAIRSESDLVRAFAKKGWKLIMEGNRWTLRDDKGTIRWQDSFGGGAESYDRVFRRFASYLNLR